MLAVSMLAGACGGGGNSRGDAPPAAPAPPVPPPLPPPQPPPADPPDIDIHLSLPRVYEAHAQGFHGSGVRVAVVDTGVNRSHPALAGRVVENLVYVGPPNDLGVDDVVGHGTWVSQILAGIPFGQWPGGVAPEARIVSARIIADQRPPDDGSGQGNEVQDPSIGEFFRGVHEDLVAADARIMNNSWGGLYWDSTAVTTALRNAYAPYVLDYGGLVVFAAGNSAGANPSDMAALPSKATGTAELERGWLTVAALDSNQPDRLADFSNACGVAMHYCLVAPGRVVVTGEDDPPGQPSYWVVGGTSMAAPQVSGAAALVWEAFPYFDNDLVRQTLLGTATDMGAPGPDAVFGYGLLDAGRAVRGPGRFDWGDVTVAFVGTSRWSNPIGGSGGLVKHGSGMLVLGDEAGASIVHGYTGTTRVEQGALWLDAAQLSGSAVEVAAAGRLDLADASMQGIDSAGRVQLLEGESHVAGDFHQRADATLGVRVGASLQVGGAVQIDGGTLEVLGLVPGYVHELRERVVGAGDGVHGSFDALAIASGVLFDGHIDYAPDAVWLDIQRLELATAGFNLGAASAGSAQRIDGAFAGLDAWLASGADAVGQGAGADFLRGAGRFQGAPSVAAVQQSVQSLGGELHATQGTAVLEAIDASAQVLRGRLQRRLGAVEGRFGESAWSAGVHRTGRLATEGYAGARVGVTGSQIGVDRRLGSGLVGFSLGKTRLDAGLDSGWGGSGSLVDEGALYAGWGRGAGYAQARLAAGRVNQRLQRRILLGTFAHGVSSRYGATYRALDVELGGTLAMDEWRLRPFLSSQWVDLHRDAFLEAGADGFGLRADAGQHRMWRATAGLEASRQWLDRTGGVHQLSTRVQRQHLLDGADSGMDASFTGIDFHAPLTGIGLARERNLLGIALESRVSERTSLGLGFTRELGDALDAGELAASVRVAF